MTNKVRSLDGLDSIPTWGAYVEFYKDGSIYIQEPEEGAILLTKERAEELYKILKEHYEL